MLLAQLVFILGITNLVSLLLVLFSCRCMLGTFVNKLWKYEGYRKFYSLHCYFWWLFVISVILHAVLAIVVYGIPS